MSTCHNCGGEIEFRHVGGRRIPIHVNGGWCSAYSSGPSPTPAKSFTTVVSYVNPNAHCPVCKKLVYYYQSPNGGRVFFDNLGWPWPKHGCTDNPRAQKERVETVTQTVTKAFRNANSEPLDLYELSWVIVKDNVVQVSFSRIGENRSFKASLSIGELRTWDVTVADLKAAPSFVVRTCEDQRILEFISARKKKIDRIVVKRPKPPSP